MHKLVAYVSLALTAAVSLGGCGGEPPAKKPDTPRTISIHSVSLKFAGREIKASLEADAGTFPNIDPATFLAGKGGSANGPLGISPENDAALIRFGNHQIRVEKQRLVVDGKESAKIAPYVTRVELNLSEKALTLWTDGSKAFSSQFEK
jgi:hypothetical protein